MKRTAMYAVVLLVAIASSSPALTDQNRTGGKYDQQIQSSLNKWLQSHSKRFKDVHATVEDGVVTLQGTVLLLVDKLDADKKAHSTDHVQGVRNDIQVNGFPTSSCAQNSRTDCVMTVLATA